MSRGSLAGRRLATQAAAGADAAFGPRQPIHRRRMASVSEGPRPDLQHESARQLPRQRSAESFFQLLKRERVRRKIYPSRAAARSDVFDYIEMFYNPKRRHGSSGGVSPVEFERRAGQSGL